MTATAAVMSEQDERRHLERLADAQQRFVKRWRPEDPYRQDEFERELFYLINLTYREAQVPITKQLTDWVKSVPMPIVMGEKKG